MKNKIKIILGICLLSGLVFAASITKFYGDIDMQSHKITNLATPTANADGATKAYVDTQISSTAITLLPLSGGTMSGAINMGGKKINNLATPTATTDASTKGYVDDEITATQDLIDTASLYASNYTTRVSVNATNYTDRAARYATNLATRVSVGATNYVNATKATLDTSITNLWKGVYKRLKLSGGQMTGLINMGNSKIVNLATPTASADAATKAYVDTLVYNSPSLIDGFLFYTMSGGTTNEARIFDVNTTGGYVRVAMLADNGGGLYNTITATMSEGTDTATVVRTESTQKAGSGFKVWLTSSATNTHYSSLKIRDGGDGGSVALIKFKYNYYITPDWGLWYRLANNTPQKWTEDAYYDAHPAYEGGLFIIGVGMTNTTARTISLQCSLSAETMESPSTSYSIEYPSGTTADVPPLSAVYLPARITDFDESKGACIYINISCPEITEIRNYGTFISLPR